MQAGTFEIEASDALRCWAELQDKKIIIHRTSHLAPGPPTGENEILLQWDIDVLRNLLTWAGQEDAVTTHFTGPLAHQIREHSAELSMTPEMFVWHAVKLFIEVGPQS